MKKITLLSSSVALATLLFTGCGIKTTEYNHLLIMYKH